MTAKGPTGAPLRQQIAEAIHAHDDRCESEFISGPNVFGPCGCSDRAADAVVALLNLTEEATTTRIETVKVLGRSGGQEQYSHNACLVTGSPWAEIAAFPVGATVQRKVITIRTPWLPSTPPDTSSSEPA